MQFLVLTSVSFKYILRLPSYLRLGLAKGLFPVDLQSTPTFFQSGYMPYKYLSSRFNHSDYIISTVQTIKFLIGEPFLSIGLPAKIFKTQVSSPILAICPAHPNLLDIIPP